MCQVPVSFPNSIVNSTLYFFLEVANYPQTLRGLGDSMDINQLVGNKPSWAKQTERPVAPLRVSRRPHQLPQRLRQLPQLRNPGFPEPMRPAGG